MSKVVNMTAIKQVVDGVVLPPGVPVEVADSIAARLYKSPRFQVTFDVNRPLRDSDGWHLLWKSPFSVSDGYAVAAEHTLDALLKSGVDVGVQSCWFESVDGLTHNTVKAIRDSNTHGYEVGVMLAVPKVFPELQTPYRIGWTMWETTDPLEQAHPDWPEMLKRIDRLWLPTAWQVPVFRRFFDGPIQVVPLSISPLYQFMDRPVRDTFTVVAWGSMTSRKAPHETVRVFQQAFPAGQYPDCRLRIKTKLGLFGEVMNHIPQFDDPRIEVYDGVWMPPDMIGFLYEADCAMLLTYGEGFGMPAREAMATGCPTLLSNNSGHEDVSDQRYNWPIRTAKMAQSSMGGSWWVPDWDQAVDTLRWVYGKREEALAKAQLGAEWFHEQWGQEAVGQEILKSLKEVTGEFGQGA